MSHGFPLQPPPPTGDPGLDRFNRDLYRLLRLYLNRVFSPGFGLKVSDDTLETDLSLSSLPGVTITDAADQDILVYDDSSGQWVNEYHDRVFTRVKNDTAGAFTKGQAVYVSDAHNANVVDVDLADASNAAKMPCIGILYQDLAAGAEGLAVTFGKAIGVAANFTDGDVLYVSPTTPGGLTSTKPTSASHLIQNVGILMQAHASNASVKVTGVGRSNDVPNQFSISGTITALEFIKSGGAADAFLLADGDAESGATARGTLGFDETAVSAGSLWYYDTGTSTWKNTNTALVYDVATGTFKSEADAADSTGLPRLSQLTTAATGKGADLIAYDNTSSGLTATKVGDAIDELGAAVISETWSLYISMGNRAGIVDSGSGTLAGANFGINSSSDYDGHSVIYNFTHSADRGVAFRFIVPGDFDTSAVMTLKVYGRLSGNPTAGSACRVGADFRAVADNEDMETGGSLANIGPTDFEIDAYSSSDLCILSLGTVFAASTLAAGDYVKGVCYREGSHANDTYAGTFQILGAFLGGTKKKATF